MGIQIYTYLLRTLPRLLFVVVLLFLSAISWCLIGRAGIIGMDAYQSPSATRLLGYDDLQENDMVFLDSEMLFNDRS